MLYFIPTNNTLDYCLIYYFITVFVKLNIDNNDNK